MTQNQIENEESFDATGKFDDAVHNVTKEVFIRTNLDSAVAYKLMNSLKESRNFLLTYLT